MSRETELPDDVEYEFTLEDAYEHLKEIQAELEQELEDRIDRDANNELTTLSQTIGQNEIKIRYHKLLRGLLKNLHTQEASVLPFPGTADLSKTLIRDSEEVIIQLQQVINSIKTDEAIAKKNIAYLESNKEGLEKMKSACLNAVENVGSKTPYDKEIVVMKRLFKKCKEDLASVVDAIFPDNDLFKNLLSDLAKAHTTGGDEVYIDVEPETLNFAKFLIEADIATYHRNDKSKIKMTDLL